MENERKIAGVYIRVSITSAKYSVPEVVLSKPNSSNKSNTTKLILNLLLSVSAIDFFVSSYLFLCNSIFL